MVDNYSFQQSMNDLQREEENNQNFKNAGLKTEKKETRVIERSTKYQLTIEPAIFLFTLAYILQSSLCQFIIHIKHLIFIVQKSAVLQ